MLLSTLIHHRKLERKTLLLERKLEHILEREVSAQQTLSEVLKVVSASLTIAVYFNSCAKENLEGIDQRDRVMGRGMDRGMVRGMIRVMDRVMIRGKV
jgi:hypothetical protein